MAFHPMGWSAFFISTGGGGHGTIRQDFKRHSGDGSGVR